MENNKEKQVSSEYLTEKEARTIKELFKKYLKSYKEKDASIPDQEWLEQLFLNELPGTDRVTAKEDAEEIVGAIKTFDDNLHSVNEAAKQGISKEAWLANNIQEASAGMSVQEYGRRLQQFDDILHVKNAELAEALTVGEGEFSRINRNPNLDGILAENMIAKTTELSGFVGGKNIRVDVLESHNANSVDVRAWNLDTGKYQNYQLKFGKDAKATIQLIERGNYNNQRIVVPTEQLDEVQAYFKSKGSSKTISDHIDAWGAKGKKFTKDELKQIQKAAQDDGILPEINYDHFQTKDLAMSIGKNAGVTALQSMVVTGGLDLARKVFKGEQVDPDELAETALKTGADTSLKTVAAGTMQIAVRKGIIKFIPKATPAGVIANIACVGIENAKILLKIASGELSITKGVDQMGRTTTSMIGGFWGMAKGAVIGAKLTGWIPVIGAPLALATGFVGGMVGYFGGSKVGDAIYSTGKRVANNTKVFANKAWENIKSAGRKLRDGVRNSTENLVAMFGI